MPWSTSRAPAWNFSPSTSKLRAWEWTSVNEKKTEAAPHTYRWQDDDDGDDDDDDDNDDDDDDDDSDDDDDCHDDLVLVQVVVDVLLDVVVGRVRVMDGLVVDRLVGH